MNSYNKKNELCVVVGGEERESILKDLCKQ